MGAGTVRVKLLFAVRRIHGGTRTHHRGGRDWKGFHVSVVFKINGTGAGCRYGRTAAYSNLQVRGCQNGGDSSSLAGGPFGIAQPPVDLDEIKRLWRVERFQQNPLQHSTDIEYALTYAGRSTPTNRRTLTDSQTHIQAHAHTHDHTHTHGRTHARADARTDGRTDRRTHG